MARVASEMNQLFSEETADVYPADAQRLGVDHGFIWKIGLIRKFEAYIIVKYATSNPNLSEYAKLERLLL